MTPCVGNVVLRSRPQYHILCECETLASLRYIYLVSFFLDPDDIKEVGREGGNWYFGKATGLLYR